MLKAMLAKHVEKENGWDHSLVLVQLFYFLITQGNCFLNRIFEKWCLKERGHTCCLTF